MIAALPDPPTPASILTLIQGIERHSPDAPAATAFRSALLRAGLEADAAGGVAALVAMMDAVVEADPDRADVRITLLGTVWADLLPGPGGKNRL